MGADMGSLTSDLEAQARAGLEEELWQKHKEATASFWDSIAGFFDALDVRGFKVYQDGLVADGEVGLNIVKEAITQGSKNYQIVGKLLERGAVLVKTEDAAMMKQEYAYIVKMAGAKSLREKEAWALRYKLAQGKLLQQRDDFIAKRIRDTLSDGETGILFIGANHDVLSRLPNDFELIEVKVSKYHPTLMSRTQVYRGR